MAIRKYIGFYGDIYYGLGNKYFYIWIADGRKSSLLANGWRLNCLGLFGISITGFLSNLYTKVKYGWF